MLTASQQLIHSEFRKYCRTKLNFSGSYLNELVKAAEVHLPALIRAHFLPDFECIYNDIYSVPQLLSIFNRINQNQELLAANHGYISSKAIQAYISFYADKHGIDLESVLIDSSDEPESGLQLESNYVEGRISETKVLHRGRNREARQQCLEQSGYVCYVCGFDFEKAYGEIGHHFLEVHHTRPLASYPEEHVIPLSELRALCSNCHSMVHRHKEVMDVEVLKQEFEAHKR